jgi:hypothetical protein
MGKYSLFTQASQSFNKEKLVLSAGLRVDGNTYSKDMSNPLNQLSPRISLAYSLTKRLSVNFNTGIFYQLPPFTILGYQQNGEFVNKTNNIKYVGNKQVVLGLEFNTDFNAKITIESFYKFYNNYPFLLRDSVTLANLGGDFGVIGNEPAIPRSNGRSYGFEFLFQQRLYKGFYGIFAYTLGWSAFEDKNGDLVSSSWDARHIISTTLGKKFKKNWEIGMNWRFQSGLPFTPFSPASSLVANWSVNNRGILDFNQINTLRREAFNTVDIRVDKKWFFTKWSLNLYLDIENITGNAIPSNQLILDRAKDADGKPVGGPVIINPTAPLAEQRYLLKTITDAQGTLLPTIGIMIEW